MTGWPKPAASPRGPSAKALRLIDDGLRDLERELKAAANPWKWLAPSAFQSPDERHSVDRPEARVAAAAGYLGRRRRRRPRGYAVRSDQARLRPGHLLRRSWLVPRQAHRLGAQVYRGNPQGHLYPVELHYEREGAGYLLYSVGPNGKDDGGKGRDDRTDPKDFNEDWDDIAGGPYRGRRLKSRCGSTLNARSQYSVLSTQYSVLSTQYSVPSTQYPVPSTQYPVLSTQYSVLGTQYSVHTRSRPVWSGVRHTR